MQGSQVSLSWTQTSLLPSPSCVFGCLLHNFTQASEMGSPTSSGVCGKCVGKAADTVLAVPQRSVNGSSC